MQRRLLGVAELGDQRRPSPADSWRIVAGKRIARLGFGATQVAIFVPTLSLRLPGVRHRQRRELRLRHLARSGSVDRGRRDAGERAAGARVFHRIRRERSTCTMNVMFSQMGCRSRWPHSLAVLVLGLILAGAIFEARGPEFVEELSRAG
jgi:hypothetical protein